MQAQPDLTPPIPYQNAYLNNSYAYTSVTTGGIGAFVRDRTLEIKGRFVYPILINYFIVAGSTLAWFVESSCWHELNASY